MSNTLPSTNDTLPDIIARVRKVTDATTKVVLATNGEDILYAADVRALLDVVLRRADTEYARRLIATALREYDAATPDDTWRDFTADQLADYLVDSLFNGRHLEERT